MDKGIVKVATRNRNKETQTEHAVEKVQRCNIDVTSYIGTSRERVPEDDQVVNDHEEDNLKQWTSPHNQIDSYLHN